MGKKVLLVATVVKAHISVFHLPLLECFKKSGWETWVFSHNDFENPEECHIPFCDVYVDASFERSPFKSGNIKAFRKLKELIEQEQFDIVSCHTPVGGVLARLASISARKKGTKVIYTAHGFHFYKGAPLKNWLLYYPIEKICARWTDTLVTINREDYAFAKKKLPAKRVEYVPGVGIDCIKFMNTVVDMGQKRAELGIPKDAFLLCSVGELNANKNHEVVMRALEKMRNTDVHYAICGRGELREYLISLAEELGIEQQIHFLGYRNDIAEIYKCSDVCVFPSIREGLGLAAIEGMAAGLPLIVSENRGTRDYAIPDKNALVCDPHDTDGFATAIECLMDSPALRDEFGKKNQEDAMVYDMQHMHFEATMNEIYHFAES